MKKLFAIVSLLVLLLMGSRGEVRATHYMGADFTWKRLATDTYEVYLTVYKDCNGIKVNVGSSYANAEYATCGRTNNTGLTPYTSIVREITPSCKRSCTRCSKSSPNTYNPNPGCSFQYGIEEIVFKHRLILKKVTCCDVKISYSDCCRPNNLTSITPGNYYIETYINRCIKGKIEARFNSPPLVVIPINNCMTLDASVSVKGLNLWH